MENHFSENLPILRRKAGYTQEALAGELGISRQSVGKWEKGQTLPEAGTLLALADLLDCSLDTLMREKLTGETTVLTLPEPVEGQDRAELSLPEMGRSFFEGYDTHMDRVAAMMGLGVGGGLAAIGNMMFLLALEVSEGISIGSMVLGLAVGIFLVVTAGTAEERIKTEYPQVPDLYTERERANFQKIFSLGCPVAGAVSLIDVVAVLFLGALLSGRRRMTMALVGVFLLVQAVAVGTMVFLACLSRKYKLGREGQPQELKEVQENG